MSKKLVLSGEGWNENINWEKYTSTFPTRYLYPTFADMFFSQEIKARINDQELKSVKYILEVGSGTHICASLQKLQEERDDIVIHTYDRYVSEVHGSNRHFRTTYELKDQKKDV